MGVRPQCERLVVGGELFDQLVEFGYLGAQAWEVDDDAFLGAAGEDDDGFFAE